MARETAVNRSARLQFEAEAAIEADRIFRLTVPALMFRLKTLAQEVHVPTRVNVVEEGFVMLFDFGNFEEVLDTFKTEQWQAEHLELKLNKVLKEQELRVGRRKLANEAIAKLSSAELTALKEFGLAA